MWPMSPAHPSTPWYSCRSTTMPMPMPMPVPVPVPVPILNVLQFHDATEDDRTAGFRRILVTEPSHPWVSGWWPPGHGLGYEHGFTHQVVDLVGAVAAGEQPTPSFADGLQVQAVLEAGERSAQSGSWQDTQVAVGAA